MTQHNLRPYQERCLEKSMEYLADPKDNKPKILVAPTAAGKSHIIAAIAARLNEPILVLQPSKELLLQNHSKLLSYGFEADIYSASAGQKTLGEITFATLGSIKDMTEQFKFMGVRTVLIDECHFKFPPEKGRMFRNFMDALNPKKVIGLTATPFYLRSSLQGAILKLMTRIQDAYFKDFIDVIQIPELTSQGYWAEIKYKLYEFDESGLTKNSAGSDFSDESIKQALHVQGINNKIYKEILQLQKDGMKNILVFMDSVENAKKMAELKTIEGATWISGDMNVKVRTERVEGFKSGKYKVLCNFGILTTGFDFPDLRCIIMGRPTLSLALYYQLIGRGTRISHDTGKTDCLYIDFCGTAQRFGRIENLVLEDVPGHGQCMTSNGLILTNTHIGGLMKSKDSVKNELGLNGEGYVDKIWFGKKFNGTKIVDLPMWYIDFLLGKADFNWSSKKMSMLKKSLLRVKEMDQQNKQVLSSTI